jgi:hypothetical protein
MADSPASQVMRGEDGDFIPAPTAPSPSPAAPVPAPAHASLAWLLGLAALSASLLLSVQLLLRPLRRALLLRHLRQPFWPESRERRVSNLWHLARIGLGDAGWQRTPGESPLQLARRVGNATVARCAERMEQVRHGLPVTDAELTACEDEVAQGYAQVRAPLRRWARAASWFRWPLVPTR